MRASKVRGPLHIEVEGKMKYYPRIRRGFVLLFYYLVSLLEMSQWVETYSVVDSTTAF
jgi:hypothetical protein